MRMECQGDEPSHDLNLSLRLRKQDEDEEESCFFTDSRKAKDHFNV